MSHLLTVEEKITLCRQRLADSPSDAGLLLELGILHLQTDTQKISDGVLAEQLIAKAIELGCRNAKAYFHLALAIRMQGKGGCERYFSEAIRLQPSFFVARQFLAHELLIGGDIKGAGEQLAEAHRLVPDNIEIEQELGEVEAILADHQSRVKAVRWPVKRDDFDDLSQAIVSHLLAGNPKQVLFDKNSRICTFGSCFAGNIARVLRKFGVDADNITFGEYINSTYANLAYLRWINGEILPLALETRLMEIFDQPKAVYRDRIAQAKLLIITLGVAPVFFTKQGGQFVLPKASQINMRLFASKYRFRTTTVDENLQNLREIVRLIRLLAPEAEIVVTVSPVPLAVTFEYDSPIIADCVSKSVLRVSADQLMRESIPGLHYWPSFEAVRWIGGYRGDAFGAEDGTTHHVSESTIEAIIRAFIEHYSAIELSPAKQI